MNAYAFLKDLDLLPASPRVDVVETKDHYQLVAELPGFAKDSVTVQVKDGVLELNATPVANEAEGTQWLLRERRTTAYQRTFRLPRDVDGDAIEAAFRDGLLVLTLPKKEEAKPRVVTIKAA